MNYRKWPFHHNYADMGLGESCSNTPLHRRKKLGRRLCSWEAIPDWKMQSISTNQLDSAMYLRRGYHRCSTHEQMCLWRCSFKVKFADLSRMDRLERLPAQQSARSTDEIPPPPNWTVGLSREERTITTFVHSRRPAKTLVRGPKTHTSRCAARSASK